MNSLKVWQASLANRTEGTRKKYVSHFNRFIEWANITPDKLREMKYLEDKEAKPWERNQVENLLRQYLEEMEKSEYTCSTQKLTYASVRSFFEAQGMPLFLKRTDRPSGCAFGSKVLRREDIRQLKNAAEYLRDKALIMFLKDSGLRESDAAKLKWKDLQDLDEGFIGFTIQTKKKRTKARGFVGPEATEILKLYKEKRLQGTQKLPPEENIEDHPVFALLTDPTKRFRPALMSGAIGDIIKLVGIEGASAHGLRKFWEQNIHVENVAYQKQMNGRALTEVERAYFWKDAPELFEMYKANYRNLKVEGEEFREVEDRLRQQYDRELETLRNRIYDLEQKNVELNMRYERLQHTLSHEYGDYTIDPLFMEEIVARVEAEIRRKLKEGSG
jgi:integrase